MCTLTLFFPLFQEGNGFLLPQISIIKIMREELWKTLLVEVFSRRGSPKGRERITSLRMHSSVHFTKFQERAREYD